MNALMKKVYMKHIKGINRTWFRPCRSNHCLKKFLVFDLDGTIIESSGDITRAINLLLRLKGLANVELTKKKK